MAQTSHVTAHSPLSLADRVDQRAARRGRSQGWVIKQALIDWVNQQEERSRLTREALAAVEAEGVIDHQTIQDWADSLDTENQLPTPMVP